MTQLLPPKKEVALALLERSNVDIYLDPRAEGVVVPPQYLKDAKLILKIGLNMPVPIPDLRLDDESMSCTLSFSRVKFFCVVPWVSVFAMIGDDGRGMVWPDDVPQELAVKTEGRPKPPVLAEVPAIPPSSRGGKTKPRLAPTLDEAPAPDAAGGKKKGGKKKKDEPAPRPMLHAVPSPPPSAPRLEKSEKSEKADKIEKAPESNPKLEKVSVAEKTEKLDEKAAPAPAPAARPGTGRPKRELPPYLRVVK